MFGRSIHLNFNNQGDYYKTNTGGIMSVFILLFFMFYIYLNLIRVVNFSNNLYQDNDHYIDLNGKFINLNQTKMMVFHNILKLDGQKLDFSENGETSKYFTLDYI